MTLAHACVLVACLLPFFCALLAKRGGMGKRRSEGGFDNHNPRAWLANQQGAAARANAAQQNSFEGLPLFIAGVLIAQQAGVSPALVNGLAIGYVACRLAYITAYLADAAPVRSLFWAAGVGCCIALFIAAF